MGLLYLGGVRVTNSYFAPALSTWRNNVLRRPENDGYANAEEMTAFNRYVARLGVMMEGLQNESNVFVYYPVENEQAVIYPATAAQFIPYDKLAETSIWELVNHIYENGYDFFLVDCDDLTDALNALQDPTMEAEDKNRFLKAIIDRIEYSRENNEEFILDVYLK